MTPLWRYLTQAAGMTAQKLADAAGMTIQQARADLAELEAQGKACRERGAVGKPHLWWRSGCQPLDGMDVLLRMALAADHNQSASDLRVILSDIGRRARDPAHRKIIVMCATAKHPHQIVWDSLEALDDDEALEAA